MTPEGSQSSEEMLSLEESQSAAPSSSSSGSVQIRVKNVSEINSNEAEANPSPPTKRKLPSWMLVSPQQVDSASNKKRKTIPRQVQCASTSSAVNDQPESSVAPSTSSNDVQKDVDQNVSTRSEADRNGEVQAEDGEISGNVEAGVSDEASTNGEGGVNDNANGEVDTNDETDAKDKIEADVEPSGSTGAFNSNGQSSSSSVAVKAEPSDNDEDNGAVGHITPVTARDIKPAVKVEKEEATSSTSRPTCRFGIRCYRQNPIHRREEAHPGDKDYQRPDFPAPPDGTPDCPYGDLCYRRNPVHFQQFNHPPSTDFEQNWKNYKMRLRQRKQPTVDPNSSYSDLGDDEDDYDLEDPFINDDSDDEFIPNDGDVDDDDDDDFL